MVESNLFPGSQPIPANLNELKYGVSVTDPCVDWATTEETLLRARDELAPVLAARAA
jgi:3-deoxy-7-phosphoheptulonate synthase